MTDPASNDRHLEPDHVSIILPCLNEAASIAACVAEGQDGLDRAGLAGEVVVVDNGSTDDSAERARRAGARVVVEPVPGYGSALRSGIASATGSILVMADADHTYDLSRVGELVAPVASGEADLVIGSRLGGPNLGTMPFLHRYVGTPALSFLIRRVCGGLRLQDSQSGYRAFDAGAIRQLHLKATGMEFASEMIIRASQNGLRIEERQIGYRPRVGESKLSTFGDGWRHLLLIILLAPQLVLFWPGLLMLALGIGLSLVSLANPAGMALGTLRWQPVFFAPILVILGSLAAASGAVIAYHSGLSVPETVRSFGFVGHPRFHTAAISAGVLILGLGLAVDGVLFIVWATGRDPLSNGLALAGIAQSLIVAGAALAIFGMVYRVFALQSGYRNQDGDIDVRAIRGTNAPASGQDLPRRQ